MVFRTHITKIKVMAMCRELGGVTVPWLWGHSRKHVALGVLNVRERAAAWFLPVAV